MARENRSPNGLSRFSSIILFGWFLAGTSFVLSASSRFDVTPSLRDESFTELALGVLLAVGSTAAIASALDWNKESTSWQLEMVGWPLLAGGWGLYTIVSVLHGVWPVPTLLSASCFFATIWRFMEVLSQSAYTRRNVKRFQAEQGARE